MVGAECFKTNWYGVHVPVANSNKSTMPNYPSTMSCRYLMSFTQSRLISFVVAQKLMPVTYHW